MSIRESLRHPGAGQISHIYADKPSTRSAWRKPARAAVFKPGENVCIKHQQGRVVAYFDLKALIRDAGR